MNDTNNLYKSFIQTLFLTTQNDIKDILYNFGTIFGEC